MTQVKDWSAFCKGCGECCTCYPLPIDLVEAMQDRQQVPAEYAEYHDPAFVIPLTDDGLCPFLSRFDRRCVVYADRPLICRLYGEIPEIPCQKLDPKAARLKTMEYVDRLLHRVGVRRLSDLTPEKFAEGLNL